VEEEPRSLGLLAHNTNWAMPLQCSRYICTMAKRHKFCMEKLQKSWNVVNNNSATTIITTIEGSNLVNRYAVSKGKYLKMFNRLVVPPYLQGQTRTAWLYRRRWSDTSKHQQVLTEINTTISRKIKIFNNTDENLKSCRKKKSYHYCF